MGDWLLLVALPVYVFIESGSGSATAILFVVELVAALVLGPVGGSLVDRVGSSAHVDRDEPGASGHGDTAARRHG